MSSLDKTSAVHTVKPECIGGEFKSSKPDLSSIAWERSGPLVSTRNCFKIDIKIKFQRAATKVSWIKKNSDSLITKNQLLVTDFV